MPCHTLFVLFCWETCTSSCPKRDDAEFLAYISIRLLLLSVSDRSIDRPIDPQDLNLCGCSKVTVDGVSDMLYERQDALENDDKTGEEVRRAGKCSQPPPPPLPPPRRVFFFHFLLTIIQALEKLKFHRRLCWVCAKGRGGDIFIFSLGDIFSWNYLPNLLLLPVGHANTTLKTGGLP